MIKDVNSKIDGLKEGDIVRFSDTLREFCHDFDVKMSSVEDMTSSTFLVIAVNEESWEVEVLSSDNDIMTFGFHDVVRIDLDYEKDRSK